MDEVDRMQMNKEPELIMHHKHVDNFWRQKANLIWNLEGEENTKFLHVVVKGRRKYLQIRRIYENGASIEEEEEIGNAAAKFYQNLFTHQDTHIDLSILEHVPNCIDSFDNENLSKIPSGKEVKKAVFDINPNSATGLDGYSGMPISLSNVTQKIISKVLSDRLANVLPKIISANQSGFIKGRTIEENALLAQEIIHDLKQENRDGNVIFKIDMNKAYNRLSWYFLCVVMRKMGFDEKWIFIIWNVLSNNWYTVVINGKRHGFFNSQIGVKQGDPISPALFIIAAETLSCMLNNLYNDPTFISFTMQKKVLKLIILRMLTT
ncbi:uncharacterized protein LOC132608170 [Lycium barbarum]|uniref:uncharacterized protein LOC132608170 n=1 Tax=Lycium barbarum TaxID=112863 RepID=UPI00293F0B37|nr:uncharacterized protein LOC132608170 [Lycium barbarum]